MGDVEVEVGGAGVGAGWGVGWVGAGGSIQYWGLDEGVPFRPGVVGAERLAAARAADEDGGPGEAQRVGAAAAGEQPAFTREG